MEGFPWYTTSSLFTTCTEVLVIFVIFRVVTAFILKLQIILSLLLY